MLNDSFDLVIIPFSLGISGLVFLAIAFYLKFKYGYNGGIKSTGTLIGFRKLDNDHYVGALNSALGHGKYKDFNHNVQNSKPIIRFTVGGRAVETNSEWSVVNLGKNDIGKQLPIRYFAMNGGNSYKVILEGKQYEQQRDRGRKIIFWIFAGIGTALIGLAILANITFG